MPWEKRKGILILWFLWDRLLLPTMTQNFYVIRRNFYVVRNRLHGYQCYCWHIWKNISLWSSANGPFELLYNTEEIVWLHFLNETLYSKQIFLIYYTIRPIIQLQLTPLSHLLSDLLFSWPNWESFSLQNTCT